MLLKFSFTADDVKIQYVVIMLIREFEIMNDRFFSETPDEWWGLNQKLSIAIRFSIAAVHNYKASYKFYEWLQRLKTKVH